MMICQEQQAEFFVALLAESVDRNVGVAQSAAFGHVALLAESVDRNFVLWG